MVTGGPLRGSLVRGKRRKGRLRLPQAGAISSSFPPLPVGQKKRGKGGLGGEGEAREGSTR